jgi:DnaJ-like protein
MTERKPAGTSFETWLDKQIREGEQRGEFDDLPGRGKPLPDRGELRDPDWWARSYLAREGGPTDALLPESLQLRKEVERLSATVRDLPAERLVRDHVAELNKRIAAWLRSPTGPHVRVRPVNADEVVAQWRAARPNPVSPPAAPEPVKKKWWQRLVS